MAENVNVQQVAWQLQHPTCITPLPQLPRRPVSGDALPPLPGSCHTAGTMTTFLNSTLRPEPYYNNPPTVRYLYLIVSLSHFL